MAARAVSARAQEQKRIPTMAERRPVESSTTCIVGCKLPNGVILQLTEMQDQIISLPMGGTMKQKVGVRVGKQYTLNGNRAPLTPSGQLVVPNYQILGGIDRGYALTHGIPREFMDEWLRQNHDSDLVRNKVIIVANDEPSVRAIAKEHEKFDTGLHPLIPDRKQDVRMRTIGMHPQVKIQANATAKTVDDVGGDD